MDNSKVRHDDTTATMHGPMRASDWNVQYSNHDHQTWSGNPNGVLLTEIAGEPPGRVLDVGCGEGADAIWLAERGWQVTAIDISTAALNRAAMVADEAGVTVNWVCGDVATAPLAVDGYDLVSVQYPALQRSSDSHAIRSIIAAVAERGTLLVVGHAPGNDDHARSQGFDPALYIEPADVAAHLDSSWYIAIDETRPRTTEPNPGSPHSQDTVLRARRL